MQHAGADDLVERSAEFPDLLDRELMGIKVLQAGFALQIARMAQARLADVYCGHMRIGIAQRMDGRLRCPAPSDEDLPFCPRRFRRPLQKRPCPPAIGVPIKLAV